MPAPRQTAADGRVRHPELARDQPGSPTGALPRLADPIVHGVADASGLPVRRRRLVVRPRAAGALGFRRSAIARDPVLDRGDTDTTPARRFAARHPPSRQRPTNSTRCHADSHLRLHCIRADDLRRPWISRRTHSFCLSPDALIPSYPAFGTRTSSSLLPRTSSPRRYRSCIRENQQRRAGRSYPCEGAVGAPVRPECSFARGPTLIGDWRSVSRAPRVTSSGVGGPLRPAGDRSG